MKKILRTFESPDRKRSLNIVDHQDGFFSYAESCEKVFDIPEVGPEIYWSDSFISGLFDSAEAAERDAELGIPWLRPKS